MVKYIKKERKDKETPSSNPTNKLSKKKNTLSTNNDIRMEQT